MVEQRAFPRTETKYAAQFFAPGRMPQNCSINDFCSGGMLIEFDYQRGDLAYTDETPFTRGNTITVTFVSPEGQSFTLPATVARVLEGAMGVSFDQPNLDALHTLKSLSHVHSRSVIPEVIEHKKEFEHIIDECRMLTNDFLSQSIYKLPEQLKDDLLLAASKATNNSHQTVIFDASAKLKRHEDEISGGFRLAVLEQIDNWKNNKPVGLTQRNESSASELSMVHKDDFEDWLVVKVIISKAEANFRPQLFDLQQRLAHLTGIHMYEKDNPVGPSIIAHAFQEMIHPLKLKPEIERIVYQTFNNIIIQALGDFYSRLNKYLIDEDILPVIKQGFVKDAGSTRTTKKIEPLQAAQEEIENAEALSTTAIPTVAPAASSNTAKAFSDQQQVARQAYETIQNLLGMQRQNEKPTGSNAAAPTQAELQTFDTTEIVSSLAKLQPQPINYNDYQNIPSLRERVSDHLTANAIMGEEKVINEKEDAAINVIENLFSSMLTNNVLTDDIKPWIKQLEVPILKVLLNDDKFFTSDNHPARQVLNRLAHLGMKGGRPNKANERTIEHFINRISNEFDDDVSIFDEVLDGLDILIERQDKMFDRNVERVTEACEGQQTIDKAKETINALINDRIGGHNIPKSVISLIDQGWKELLVLTCLREGPSSAALKDSLNILDEILKLTFHNPDSDTIKKEAPLLLKKIEAGLQSTSHGQVQGKRILKALAQTCKQHIQGLKPESINIPVDKHNMPEETLTADESLSRWIERVKKIQVGTWIALSHRDQGLDQGLDLDQELEQEEQRMRLAWLGEDNSKYVFVNHQGLKVIEYTLNKLAQNFKDGFAKLIDDMDVPIVDQSLDHMVQDVYGQLTFQATHDELTNLINRKEFERRLDKALADCKRNDTEHVVCHIDLDQFKVVNNTCGYEAGDILLKEIAELLKETTVKEAVVARIGDDEFGLLIYNSTEDQGQAIAARQVVAIQDHRFIWEEKTYTVGASIGLIHLNKSFSTSTDVLKYADSACLSAKEAGRNRVHTYKEDDIEMSRRDDVMEWVSKLNQALDDDRLHLRCQRIEPIDKEKGLEPHYEILLSIEDETGAQLAPSDFIHAAERYNRMQAVDRWVILTVFEWMRDNPEKLKRLGGCAINLSGHSLNDENLMNYIFEKFSECKVPRDKICFEVTETTAIANIADAADFIREMKEIGCSFSLDDFGSGLSSYSYLKNLPVDYLKIDGSFVKEIAVDEADYSMVKSINEMGHMMGKKTIAEFVENEAILEKLKEIGVDYAQGYYIEKPVLLKDM